jgi:hypothetical protein
MNDVNSSTSERVGETIAEVDGVGNVSIIAEEDDEYQVSMVDGTVINTTEDGIESLENIDWTDYPIDEDWSSPPWKPNPDPNPLDPDSDDTIGTFTTPQTRTVESKINYICPECDGQFRSWLRESGSIGEDDTYMCPFCKTERGNYGEDTDVSIEEAVEVVREKLEEEEDAQWFAELLGIVGDDQ